MNAGRATRPELRRQAIAEILAAQQAAPWACGSAEDWAADERGIAASVRQPHREHAVGCDCPACQAAGHWREARVLRSLAPDEAEAHQALGDAWYRASRIGLTGYDPTRTAIRHGDRITGWFAAPGQPDRVQWVGNLGSVNTEIDQARSAGSSVEVGCAAGGRLNELLAKRSTGVLAPHEVGEMRELLDRDLEPGAAADSIAEATRRADEPECAP